MKLGHYNIVLFCALLITLLLGQTVLGQMYITSDDNLSIYVDDSLYVDTEGTFFIDANMYCLDNYIYSNGLVALNSSDLSEILLPSLFSGNGTLAFLGTGDFDLISTNDFWVNNLTINTDGVVSLASNFNVGKLLTLKNGVFNVASPNVLLVESDDADAVSFNDDSYVIGYLGRSMSTSNTYYFPVGASDGAYPLFINSLETSDVLVAKFDDAIATDAELELTSESGLSLLSESGWQIYGEDRSQNSFLIGLWAPEQFDASGTAGILHSEYADFSEFDKILNTENTTQSYLATTENTSNGYFALIEDNSSNSDDIDLRNFFFVGNGNETVFEIPDASQYSNIQLTLYNKLGVRVFYTKSYTNQLDLANYATGTYYYELVLKSGSTVKKIYDFIDVKNEGY
jgi:hypothetical protein